MRLDSPANFSRLFAISFRREPNYLAELANSFGGAEFEMRLRVSGDKLFLIAKRSFAAETLAVAMPSQEMCERNSRSGRRD